MSTIGLTRGHAKGLVFVKLGITSGSIEVIPSLERGWILRSPPYGVWVNVVGTCIGAEPCYKTHIEANQGSGSFRRPIQVLARHSQLNLSIESCFANSGSRSERACTEKNYSRHGSKANKRSALETVKISKPVSFSQLNVRDSPPNNAVVATATGSHSYIRLDSSGHFRIHYSRLLTFALEIKML